MILVAPTSFKGTHTAAAVTQAMVRAVNARGGAAIAQPVSDGGPGLLDALQAAAPGHLEWISVSGPLGDVVTARILVQAETAIIETADACGLQLVPPAQRDPLRTTTYGVGELLATAGARAPRVIAGLGGSATIDAGLGMAQALGFQLLSEDGAQVEGTGAGVLRLARIGSTRPMPLPSVTALTDVRNPLYGPLGAARIFGAQKGATPEQIGVIDEGMQRLAGILRRDLGVDVATLSGAGAAGGLGAGLVAFARAQLWPGSEWVLREIGFDALLKGATLLVTGEGSYDAQSGMGKITGELIARAQAAAVPVLLVAGSITGALPSHVRAVTGHGMLELADIERLTHEGLAQLLAQ